MSGAVTPTSSQGVISAQVEQMRHDRQPASAPPPEPAPEPAPPSSGRGATVDTSA